MYLLGFSLDNLSLMALTVATGFVIDDAIVVLENISRHIEDGMPKMEAVLHGRARGGLHRHLHEPVADRRVPADPADGRHRRRIFPQFAMTLSHCDHGFARRFADDDADAVPLSAPTRRPDRKESKLLQHAEARFRAEPATSTTARSSGRCEYPGTIMLILLVTIGLNFYLFYIVPKDFLPSEDTGESSAASRRTRASRSS